MDIVQERSILAGNDDNLVRHQIFWFEDGSVVVRVQDHLFKVHQSLLARHSNFFAHFHAVAKTSSDNFREDWAIGCDYIVVDLNKRVLVQDVEVLLEHLYHDVSLFSEVSFSRIASALRVSSPLQLDFPSVHTFARQRLLSMYNGSLPFFRPGNLGDALALASEYDIIPMRKAVYYMLVASSDYNFDSETDSTKVLLDTEAGSDPPYVQQDKTTKAEQSESYPHQRILSQIDAKRCTRLMTCLIDHFTPILFTPPAASHRSCTDIFAETWMSLVIQPGLENDGVYKPLETLQRMKDTDWEKEGLCQSCVKDKHSAWTEEQRNIWDSMDEWLKLE
ncbi:hypothetical protein L208DRAFT_1421801 [Tricholoma matsutake]|nr:hypothetical protein L208DRAFT_1421801 [Tricholoma matsutake 945]